MKIINFIAVLTILFVVTTTQMIKAGEKSERKAGDAISCYRERIGDYHERISAMNLLNGLHLTKEQTQKLLDLNRELENSKNACKNNSQFGKMLDEAESSMKNLYEYMLTHPEQEDKGIQDKAAEKHGLLKDNFLKQSQKYENLKSEIVKKAEAVLTPEQLEVVSSFKPCLIPPKDLRDPVRAGQAASSIPAEKLSKVRDIKNKEVLDRVAERVADRVIEKTNESFYKMTPEEQQKKRAEIIQIIKQANKMDDTEFVVKRDELVKKITPEDKLKELGEEIQKRNPHIPESSTKGHAVSRFLIKPEILIPILEKRLEIQGVGGLK